MLDEIIQRTNEIVSVLERPERTGWSNSLRDSLEMLTENPHSTDALDFIHSACTSAKGLQDVWVQEISQDEWFALLTSLRDAVDQHRASKA